MSLYLFGISLHDVRVPPGSFFALFPVQAHRSGADGSDTRGDTDGVAIRGRTNPTVFPGIDGSLYAYAVDEASADGSGSGALHGEVSRLPVTARQLVEASPSVTRDGGVVMGTRRSVVFAVDRRTGELLRSFDTDGTVVHGGNDEGFFLSNDPIAAEPEPTRDAFYIGRTEYVVRSVDSSTGQERWNVTYGEVTPLTSTEGGGGGGGGGRWMLTNCCVAPQPLAPKPCVPGLAPHASSHSSPHPSLTDAAESR